MVQVNDFTLEQLAKKIFMLDLKWASAPVDELTKSNLPEVRGKALEVQGLLTSRKSSTAEKPE